MENLRFKFRAWDKLNYRFLSMPLVGIDFENDCVNSYEIEQIADTEYKMVQNVCYYYELMQYTGLKDKNGVEIYEYMEIDNTYEVSFLNGSYVLTNISNGDVILLSNYMENNNGKVEITREYTKV